MPYPFLNSLCFFCRSLLAIRPGVYLSMTIALISVNVCAIKNLFIASLKQNAWLKS